jgi:hypothetical protein
VAEFAAHDLLARRAGDRVFEGRQPPAVEQAGGGSHSGLGLVGEDGDETGRGAEALGHLANEVVEEGGARGPRCRQRDPM